MEKWKKIPGWPDYSASTEGRIRRDTPKKYGVPAGILRPQRQKSHAYLTVNLFNPRGTQSIHKLVLLTFRGPRPIRHQAAHRDGNTHHNWLSNLRWATPKQNAADTARLGRKPRGEDHVLHKLTVISVQLIRLLRTDGWTLKELGTEFHVSHVLIQAIVIGKNWRYS